MFQSAGMILPHECHKKHPLMWDFDSQTAANVSEVETKVLLCAFPTNDKESELCWWEDTNVTDKTRKCIPNPIQHFCYEPLALFPPSKHCDKAVLPFLFSFPFLLTPLSAPFRSPRRFRPLWLWKPAVANYGETKGGTWTGSPGSTASQAGRQPLSVPVESSNSSLPPASCCEHRTRGGMSMQEDNAANGNSNLGSPLSACGFFFFSFLLTFTLLPRLSSPRSLSKGLSL